jgi:hypothetical protein
MAMNSKVGDVVADENVFYLTRYWRQVSLPIWVEVYETVAEVHDRSRVDRAIISDSCLKMDMSTSHIRQ